MNDGIASPAGGVGYVALEKGIPRSSKSFLGAATSSPVYGIGLVLVRVFCGPGAGGIYFPFCRLDGSLQLGLWASPSPSGLLQKAAAGQRLPTDLHNCTVP